MNNMNPKVSIIIPVYNGSNFLSEAIDSALAQTYKNIEIIVINDGSNDNDATEKIAKSYGNKIKYYHKENGGVATALNLGIEKMTGDYFSWLSHDDLYESTKIKDQIDTLKSYKEDNVIVASNASVLFSSGVKKHDDIDKNTFKYFDIFLATSAVVGVNGCSLLIPRKSLIQAGGFDVNLPVTQDYDLWFRLKDNNKFILNEKNLVISRRHDKQDSVKKQKICFEAGDKLHYDFINDITYQRFEEYFNDNDENINHYWNNYSTYKIGGYKKTAAMMLKNLLKYYYNNDVDKFNELFQSEVGSIVNPTLLGEKKAKKRVLFYSSVWHRGGIERVLSHIFYNLGNDYDFVLVVNEDKIEKNIGFDLPDNLTYVKINNQNQIAELMDVLSFFDIDIFVGNPNFSDVFIDIYTLLKDTVVKSIAYNHGYYFLPYMCDGYLYPTALKIKKSYNDASSVIWLSQIACNIYNIENNNGVYLPNPVILIKDAKPKTAPAKKIIAVGRFDDEIKRIDNILVTFRELYRLDNGYQLDIVGYCPLDIQLPWQNNITLKDYIKKENIPLKNIKFWGIQKDLSRFYKKATFLLMASRCEGFAMVLVEALSYGTPCACFEYIGVEEIVQSGKNGWVLPQGEFIKAAEKINNTINDKNEYLEMSKKSLESVEKYEINGFCEKWKLLIEQTLNSDKQSDKSLSPSNDLSSGDYKRLLLQYEKLLNIAVKNFINKQQPTYITSAGKLNRVNEISNRFKTSIKRDGILLTGEKIVRKVHNRLSQKR